MLGLFFMLFDSLNCCLIKVQKFLCLVVLWWWLFRLVLSFVYAGLIGFCYCIILIVLRFDRLNYVSVVYCDYFALFYLFGFV